MVKLKNRVFKAGVVTCIVLVFFASYVQTIYSENLYVFSNVEVKLNFLLDPPGEEWNETFGGTDFEEGLFVQQTSDGGYIITGYTNSFGAGGYDVWLIKTDSNGLEEWNQTFGGEDGDKGHCVQQTSDGGYIITGFTHSFGAGGYDVWLIKTDSNGSSEWNETFGGSNFDEGFSVEQTSDGGYILTGRTSSYGVGGHDLWLIKTDSNGSEEWNETFGGSLYDYGYSVKQTSDGGYVITGFFGGGHFDVWLIKTNSFGSKEWEKMFGGYASDGGYCVQQTSDGGYIVLGYTSSYGSGGSDAWLIKTDCNGSKEWDEFFGGTDLDIGFSVVQTADGGYFITGYNLTYVTGDYDAWVIKTDCNGSEEWEDTFKGTDIDAGNFGQQTSDGGYIVVGRTGSTASGDHDVWLIRIETENNPPYEPSEPIPENNSVNVNVDANISWNCSDPDEDALTYDIYFGTTNPPSKIASNHTKSTYELDLLDYTTVYYWQIVAWDYYETSNKGPIWSFTTENTPMPDLECEGSLSWTDVQSGDTITGDFTVENVGGNGTFLNWAIVRKPNWGEWSFDPANGDDLETGVIQTVMITVIAPSEKNEEFIGEVMIINEDEPSDSCTIDVSLATPKNKPFNFNFPLFSWFFERFPNVFPILRYLLRI